MGFASIETARLETDETIDRLVLERYTNKWRVKTDSLCMSSLLILSQPSEVVHCFAIATALASSRVGLFPCRIAKKNRTNHPALACQPSARGAQPERHMPSLQSFARSTPRRWIQLAAEQSHKPGSPPRHRSTTTSRLPVLCRGGVWFAHFIPLFPGRSTENKLPSPMFLIKQSIGQ